MSQSRAANSSLLLVIVGWLVSSYGVLSQLGDPAPSVTKAAYLAHRELSFAIFIVGMLCLLGALWLSGYCYPAAKVRSLLTVVGVVVPAIAAVLSLL
jgi:hypothetical protein